MKHLDKTAFDTGFKAFRDNTDNIYPVNSMRYKEWIRGFNLAYELNRRRVIAIKKSRSVSILGS